MEFRDDQFEVFVARTPRVAQVNVPSVKLSKQSISLNKTARELLCNPEFVSLAYDKNNHVIRIMPSESGIAVRKTKFRSKVFFSQFDIDVTGKYDGTYNEASQALFVSLSA